ncbi:MAG TPA: cytochrome c [Devosia sp.]|jgi:mono/diheme cytochrome c family protein|nr:cytochrome c [Devosia sp.]
MRRLALYPVVVALAGLGLASSSVGQDNPTGADAFRTTCAVCHGSGGQGDGEFADVMTVKPPNLTLLSEKYGEFPYLRVFHAVDGRTTIPAHGSRVMPIWGDYFRLKAEEAGGGKGGSENELLIRAQIVALVDYVQSLQK